MKARSLRARLLVTYLAVTLGALGILGVAMDRVFEQRALRDLQQRLIAEARVTQSVLARDGIHEDEITSLGASSGARLTVIRTDGVVLADSEHDPSTMENHSTRPEVRAALAGRIGSDERVSGTLGVPFLYVALPARDSVIVRAALPEVQVVHERSQIRVGLAAALVATAAIAAIVSLFVARTVAGPLQRISAGIGLVAGGESTSVTVEGPREARTLAHAINAMAGELAARLEAIRRETSLRDRILGSMHEAVMLVDEGRVAYANPAAKQLFGAREGERPSSAIAAISTGQTETRDITLHHPERRDVQLAMAEAGDGRTLIVARDVTESRRIDRIRRDFVSNASHELKTPVAAILATAETLQTAVGEDPRAAKRFAATLAAEAQRLSALVQDLLDLARVEQAQEGAEDVDLGAIVAAEVESMPTRHIRLVTHIGRARVNGRASDLALLARNLLDNAVRYTPDGGVVTVTVEPNGSVARLVVQDTGVGIPEKDLPRIFERFFRVDQARARDTGGTGLGLAIVRHVAESHNGTVTARSRLGEGSTFTVELPLAES